MPQLPSKYGHQCGHQHDDKRYRLLRGPELEPGNYDVSVAASGFEKTVHAGIVLLADGHPSIDLALKVGNSNQTVVVEGDSPLIDTQSVSVGQVLTSEEMSALPNGQAPIWLAMLSPGVQSNYAQNYQLGGADPSWNGAGPQFGSFGRIGANEFSLDGAPNMANQRGQAINLSCRRARANKREYHAVRCCGRPHVRNFPESDYESRDERSSWRHQVSPIRSALVCHAAHPGGYLSSPYDGK
jgi:hypothetical protein